MAEPVQEPRRVLIVSNAYPRATELYRYQFLHARVLAYRESGLACDVFVVDTSTTEEGVSQYLFEGVKVLSGSPIAFGAYIEKSDYLKFLVHFPMPYMLDAIDRHSPNTPTVWWLHGFEAEAWWRRWFNHLDGARMPASVMRRHHDAAQGRLERLSAFLDSHPETVTVTVSHWFRKHCIEPDLGRSLPHSAIIPNYIDNELFRPTERPTSAQRRVLVLRPFTSAKYAGQDIIRTILRVSAEDPSIEFTVCGDGPRFDSAVRPLSKLTNVDIRKGFLTRPQVAELHLSHGIFLNPTWWDSQGVSAGEAMASGLAVITTNIAAVPEFIEHEVSGILVAPGDVEGLASAVQLLAVDDQLRQSVARCGRERAIEQCGFDPTIRAEVALITGTSTPDPPRPINWEERYHELAKEFTEVLCYLGTDDV